jgi:hypothetical protein
MATSGQNPVTRVAGGEGQRWEMQEGNKPHFFRWGRGGPRRLADGGTELAVGADGGGGGPVRKMAWGPAVQLQGEVEKVVGGLVWAMWGQSGAPIRR